jgi:glyoxylase-like metal-dependent hydrolase (beta-lactamase superfamily II)
MRLVRSFLPVAFLFLVVPALPVSAAEEVAGLPLHVQRLDAQTVRVWVGDFVSTTNVVAFATAKGVVVVDTTGVPKVDRELRRVIARELGRSDFKVLVDTHEHGDHTGGNSVYADATIVAHERCAAGMRRDPAERERVLAWQAKHLADLEKAAATHPAGSVEARKAAEELAWARLNDDVWKENTGPALPTKTFADRLTLDMGDATFELFFVGGMHSASDVAVFVPERGILMTGDTMADRWLTDTPGCLASFAAREGVPHDFPLLVANGERLLARKEKIRTILPGHWNGELSFAGFEARLRYVEALWEGVGKLAKEGKPLEEALAAFPLEARFPDLAKSPGFNARNHVSTVSEIWAQTTGLKNGATELFSLIEAGAPDERVKAVVADRGSKTPKYYFLEREVNARGYFLLQQQKKAPEAVRMFRVNAELFPASWNVWDSLGEGLLAAGDVAGSKAAYEKSVQINPENRNGKEALEKLRGEAAKSSS